MASITTIQATDTLAASRSVINDNFSALNTAIAVLNTTFNTGTISVATSLTAKATNWGDGVQFTSGVAGADATLGFMIQRGAGDTYKDCLVFHVPMATGAFVFMTSGVVELMRMNAGSGNLGIGPGMGNYSERVAINGSVRITSANGLMIGSTPPGCSTSLFSPAFPENDYTRTILSSYAKWNTTTKVWDIYNGGGTDYHAIVFGNGGTISFICASGLTVPTTRTNAALIADTKLRIASSGNVQIGTTTDAGYKLDVNGTSLFRASIALNGEVWKNDVSGYLMGVNHSGGTNNGNYGLYFDRVTESIGLWTANTLRFVIDGFGKLSVYNDLTARSGAYFMAVSTNGSVTSELFSANSGGYVGTLTAHPFVIRTSDLDRIKVSAAGRVSIYGIPQYADNTAALSAGLVTGDLYRTSTGSVQVVT